MTRLSLHLACHGRTVGSLPRHTRSRDPTRSRANTAQSPSACLCLCPRSRSGARFIPLSRPSHPAGSRPSVFRRGLPRKGPRNREQVLRELPGAQRASILLTTHLSPSPPAAPLPEGLLPPDKEQRAERTGPTRPPYRAGGPRFPPAPPTAGSALSVRMHRGKKSRPFPSQGKKKNRGAKKNPVRPSAHAPFP